MLIIDDTNITSLPSPKGDSSIQFLVSAIFANNADDTLEFTLPWAKDALFYDTDNANLQVINNDFIKSPAVICDTIPPHECRRLMTVRIRFNKLPDKSFKFKLGVRLLKWRKEYKVKGPDSKTIQQADMLWSDEEVFKTDRKLNNYDKTPLEWKAKCEKVVDTLSDEDRHKYILSIDQRAISKLKDTTDYYLDSVAYRKDTTSYQEGKKQFKFASVQLKLTNNSNNVLEYTSWSCSWCKMYQTDSKSVSVEQQICSGNYPITETVPPHSSVIFNMPILFDTEIFTRRYKFKIGMTLLKADLVSFHGFDYALPLFKQDPRYLIWSNEIIVPVSK